MNAAAQCVKTDRRVWTSNERQNGRCKGIQIELVNVESWRAV